MDKVKIICYNCRGRGILREIKYKEGTMVTQTSNGTPYYARHIKGKIVTLYKSESELTYEDRIRYVWVKCTKCNGKGYLEVEVEEDDKYE